MSIYHPTYSEFIRNERKTLKYLMDSPSIRKYFPKIAESAENSYYSIPSKVNKMIKSDFVFSSCFNLYIEREKREVMVILEAQVRNNFSLSNYVVALCENIEAPYNLIRKFHFDYVRSNDNKDPKPVYHFQYAGQPSPLLVKMGIDVKALKPWLSNPRFCFYPINLALLIDSIFYEFISDNTNKIVSTSEWRCLVKENEESLLKPYYKGMHHFIINGNHTSNYLIRDCLYGKK